MKKTIFKTILAILIIFSLLIGCSKNDADPSLPDTVDHSKDPVELIASGKGFKKVFGYVESDMLYFPGTLNEIHGLDLTVEGTDKVNFAFSQSRGSQQGPIKSVLRCTANYITKTVTSAPVAYIYSSPTGSSWQELGFSYAPYSNKLAYMYYMYSGPGYVTGDLLETSGQSLLTTDRRIAKTGHSVYNIVGSQGAGSATNTNGFTYAYFDNSGQFKQLSSSDGTYTGIQFQLRASSEYRGIFEPILATNEGIVILFSKDSVNVYLNNLATPAVKFKQIAKVSLTTKMTMTGNSIIKNNANDDDFSFACLEGSVVWSYKYNNKTKSLTKVIDGASLPTGAKSLDIDENGNLYYRVANSVFKQSATTGTTTLVKDVLMNGDLSLLKYYNGKVFLLAERFKNSDGTQARSQLDLLVQE
jgi:hypothetical protein